MTEEDKLRRAPGCGVFIMVGLIGIVVLSLFGLIFPGDILPQSNEILIGVIVIGSIAAIIAFFMWRRTVKDRQEAEDAKADALLRRGFETLGDKDDEASRLAAKYYDDNDAK